MEENENEPQEEVQEDTSVSEDKPVEERSDDRKMYKATCSECQKECEVPFEPVEGKPVRCQECFAKYRSNRPRRNFGRNQGFNRGPRQMHDAVCAECKKECQVPFKPSGDKPVLCRDCYTNKKSN